MPSALCGWLGVGLWGKLRSVMAVWAYTKSSVQHLPLSISVQSYQKDPHCRFCSAAGPRGTELTCCSACPSLYYSRFPRMSPPAVARAVPPPSTTRHSLLFVLIPLALAAYAAWYTSLLSAFSRTPILDLSPQQTMSLSSKLSITDVSLKGERVLIRVDFNVPSVPRLVTSCF